MQIYPPKSYAMVVQSCFEISKGSASVSSVWNLLSSIPREHVTTLLFLMAIWIRSQIFLYWRMGSWYRRGWEPLVSYNRLFCANPVILSLIYGTLIFPGVYFLWNIFLVFFFRSSHFCADIIWLKIKFLFCLYKRDILKQDIATFPRS